ncbi:hypothetical protein KJB58_10810 [Staphylococcus hyicus]|uniref:Uncharacterized protein n=1 Tax=Staphylococcus hyicus TaxID=1284 RepID=A0A418JGQ0_STAHY|nr:hypothetical protein [Staphylococcus hyicus]MCE5154951.1 hypothetical protein [Staphylococcus hyicus]RIO43485.1 hypothetical protein BUZ57_10755 [Staphylococcus hyicus]
MRNLLKKITTVLKKDKQERKEIKQNADKALTDMKETLKETKKTNSKTIEVINEIEKQAKELNEILEKKFKDLD